MKPIIFAIKGGDYYKISSLGVNVHSLENEYKQISDYVEKNGGEQCSYDDSTFEVKSYPKDYNQFSFNSEFVLNDVRISLSGKTHEDVNSVEQTQTISDAGDISLILEGPVKKLNKRSPNFFKVTGLYKSWPIPMKLPSKIFRY